MYRKIKNFITRSFYEGVQLEDYVIMAVAIFGPVCHFFVYFFHKYAVNLEYTNLEIRVFISLICLCVYFYKYLPSNFKKKYFPFYWYATIILGLPLQCTFFLLKNNFNEILLYWGIFCVMLTSVFISNWFMVVVSVVFANILAVALYYLSTPASEIDTLDITSFNILGYGVIYIFCIIFGTLFVWVNKKSWLLKESRYLKSLAGSIAHEIRNPLNSINVINNQINNIIADIEQDLQSMSKKNKNHDHENKPK